MRTIFIHDFCSSRPSYRRERLESDIPPETREEREQRLEFERKLRKRAQREEGKVLWKTKESHRDKEFRKRSEGAVGVTLVEGGELQEKGGEVDEGNWKKQEKFDEEAGGCKEVHQGDSTPSLSPETNDNSDGEVNERNVEEDSKEDDVRKDIVQKGKLVEETASGELCSNEGDTGADDSSEEDSVKEEVEPKKMVRSRSHSGEKSVDEIIAQDQESRLPTDDQVKVSETSDFKSVEDKDDSVQGQEHGSKKDSSAMREELKMEKMERKELMTSSSECEERKAMKRKKHVVKDESSDGEKVEDKKRKKMKKQKKKDRITEAECEKKMKRAKKDKKAEKKAKKEKKSKKKKTKKEKRKSKDSDSTSSEPDLDGGIELLEPKKKKGKKAGKAPKDVTVPIDLSQLRTMMRENLITDKELRRLMKATVKSEKEKKVTFKISEFSRNSGQELMKALFSKKSLSDKKKAKREASGSSPESGTKKHKADTKDEELLSDLSGEENKCSKTKVKKDKRGRKEHKRVIREERKVSLERSRERAAEVGAGIKEDEERQHKIKLDTKESRKGGEGIISEKKENKRKKRKRSNSEERWRCEAELEKEEGQRTEREERVCKRKEDGMLEVKVANKKPVGRLLEERLVNDERLGKKVMINLLEREERQDMMERLGPMPSRASKRSW